jgi:hypothetical protein
MSKYPMVTNNQSIVITTEEDKETKMPPMTIRFKIKTDKEIKFMDECHVTINNRSQEDIKEYPMDDVGVKVYYNKTKKIASLYFMSQERTEDSKPSPELIDLLNALKDAEAIQAYRMAAWYWVLLDYGFGIFNGEYALVKPEELEELGLEEDDDDYDSKSNWLDDEDEDN